MTDPVSMRELTVYEVGSADQKIERSDIVGLRRSIDELVHLIEKKWLKFEEQAKGARSTRLETALLLFELRRRVEGGEMGDEAALDWWSWYESRIPRSRVDGEKLLAIAAAEDPQLAYEAAKMRSANSNALYKAKRKKLNIINAPSHTTSVRGSGGIVDAPQLRVVPKRDLVTAEDRERIAQILTLFTACDWAGRKEAIQAISRKYREWHG